MILVNIPHIIGWFLLYNASSITELFIAGEYHHNHYHDDDDFACVEKYF